jgi:DNA-directed RNA polymerase I subunit RPA2
MVIQRPFGRIPVMVRSNKCWLNGLKPAEMVAQREDATEPGGYFIVNGIEKLIRLLVVTRANYVMAVVRQAYQKRGSSYSTMGTLIRCVRPDSTSVTVTLHYLHEGLCNVKFMIQKQEFFVPVVLMLRALVPCSDREVYERLVQGDWENTFLTERAELNIREVKRLGLYAHEDCLAYLGRAFRVVLALPARLSDEEAGRVLLRRYVFVHLETDVRAKFDLLVLMFRKLLALVRGDIQEDNFDSPANQELLLGGHLYTALFKEKLQDWLLALRGQILRDLRQAPAAAATVDLTDPAYMSRVVTRCGDLGRKLEYFLATGNLRTNTGLDLMQVSGFCIIAERLNYLRFLSHLRCVHRGSFFAEMKTTSVRKLLPDSWGFLCPVHTPDGAPCGLLNHLSSTCRVVTEPAMGAAGARALAALLASLGMQQAAEEALVPPRDYLPVCLDGRVLGHVSPALAPLLAERLRLHKVLGTAQVPAWLEIALLPPERGGAYPGLYLFSGPARMMRPVANLRAGGRTELIGSLEQLYLDVACLEADLRPGRTSHRELKPTQVLSVVANLTPFCDFNQSPRNMYQWYVLAASFLVPPA